MENLVKNKNIIPEDVVNLVVARLEAIPSNVQISIGGDGNFTIIELIDRVKKQDEIGIKMVEMQLNYLRSLSNLPTGEVENAFAN